MIQAFDTSDFHDKSHFKKKSRMRQNYLTCRKRIFDQFHKAT